MKTSKVMLLTAILGLSAAHSAMAVSTEPSLPRTDVKYSDLNLSTTDGAATLYGRLMVAAKRVCRSDEGRTALYFQNRRECVRDALDGAVASVNQPALTSYHLSRTVGASQPAG